MPQQLGRVVSLVDDVLGPDRLGTYLYGSAVEGGLRPASDLDVLVVTRRRVDGARAARLVRGLLDVSGRRNGGRPLEVTVVSHSQVQPWRPEPVVDLVFGEWLRDVLEAEGPPEPAALPDLALTVAQALRSGRTLAGPPPAQVLGPVPVVDLVRASLDGVPGLLADLPHDTRNVLLTLARVWVTVETGEVLPKDVAAAWALERVPPEHRATLEHTRGLYLDTSYADEIWDAGLVAGVPALAAGMVGGIEAAVSAARRS